MVGKLNSYIPLEIQEEIMKRLPVESLIRFRSVSKPWKSLIHSSKFIADHRVQRHRLLVVSYDTEDKNLKWVSIVDDDAFPQRKLDLTLPIPFNDVMQIESSHGLLCLLCRNLVVLMNPTIRKSVSIDVPDVFGLGLPGETTYGFGVCPATHDPKLVRVKFNHKLGGTYSVEVFTLSSGVWRSPRGNLPRKSIRLTRSQVSIDGCIYLEAHDYIRLSSGVFKSTKLIISFATTSEEFTEISYPNSLALKDHSRFWISKLWESLVVVEFNPKNQVYGVWMMMIDGDPKSFTQIYRFILGDASLRYIRIHAFRVSREALVKLRNCTDDTLFVYNEPSSKQYSFGYSYSNYLSCYTESLLLLDH